MTPILEASQLARTFDAGGVAVLALRGVELSLGRGEFVAVMGPSGCGKSTLLHLLAGLDRPTAGTVILDGERVDRLGETAWARLRRRRIGFVFQAYNLLPNLTAAENVELPALLVGRSRGEAATRRAELFEQLALAGKEGALPAQLSGGGQQRVAIARALVNRPAIVLADEPTGNLDTRAAAGVVRLLRELGQGGQAILLVTHDPRVAAAAGRVVTMRDGLVIDDAELSEAARPLSSLSSLLELEA
jgi:putative ABC transport system ATP-binding protein